MKNTIKTQKNNAMRNLWSMPIIPERAARPGHNPMAESMIILIAKKWVNATNLTYYFQDGTAAEKEKVRQGFNTWKNVGIGLTFEELTNRNDAIIRIGFVDGDGSWSYVGRDCWNIPKNQLTMNFGWDITNDLDTILHEIGHAMGFPHEHQNPFAGIVWNEPKVVNDLSGPPNNWDLSTIRHNVLDKKAADEIQGSELDEDSIMMYPMPGSWITQPPELTDGISPAPGLSNRDKLWVKSFYPDQQFVETKELQLYKCHQLKIKAGEQINFKFIAPSTKDFEIRTFGDMDTVMVLNEIDINSNEIYLAGDDDSGSNFNSYIKIKLVYNRRYMIRIRLYNKSKTGNTTVMVF